MDVVEGDYYGNLERSGVVAAVLSSNPTTLICVAFYDLHVCDRRAERCNAAASLCCYRVRQLCTALVFGVSFGHWGTMGVRSSWGWKPRNS